MHQRLFRPKPQRLTNHQRYGTSCLEETVLGSVSFLGTPFANAGHTDGDGRIHFCH